MVGEGRTACAAASLRLISAARAAACCPAAACCCCCIASSLCCCCCCASSSCCCSSMFGCGFGFTSLTVFAISTLSGLSPITIPFSPSACIASALLWYSTKANCFESPAIRQSTTVPQKAKSVCGRGDGKGKRGGVRICRQLQGGKCAGAPPPRPRPRVSAEVRPQGGAGGAP